MRARDCILVVDDNPESLRFLVDTLEAEEMTVLIARSGEATLALLREVQPDLILMDAIMPGIDGIETTQAIKRTPKIAHIPVIFMTGLCDPGHVVTAFSTGGVDYVRKPVVIEELLARIRAHLANARTSHRSRLALGFAGRSLVALSDDAELIWCTPQAEALFVAIDPAWTPDRGALPQALADAAYSLTAADPVHPLASVRVAVRQLEIDLTLVEMAGPGETLIRVTEVCEDGKITDLQKNGGLTRREAEVLLWVSYGKTNKTVSEVLGISPRTVNKHLEKVFRKLGVETRAAATAIAVRYLTD
ncbi:MAG: response regulator [Sphingomonadales bacterium]|nr:response regulator [Sphingomonadales bacterium]NCQ19808.1 response regulator [Sphingomonadales bacterium]NCT05067.1 response regulator [Sphingomonadales bacterium]